LLRSTRLILGAAGLAAGFGRIRIAGAASQVTIGVTETPCVAPAYAAVSQGFLRDEGLDATIVDISTPGNLGLSVDGGNALAAGRADAIMDAVWTAVPPRTPSRLGLGDILITAALQRGCVALVVSPDSPIQAVGDLRGQTIAGARFVFGAPMADAGLDPNVDVIWAPAPSIADEVPTLRSGEVAAVQTINAQAVLLERAGLARMIAVNDMPPQQSDFCCGCVMLASGIQRDRPKAMAITRALMRAAVWSEAHQSEVAQQMLNILTVQQNSVALADWQAAMGVLAFVPMAESARPILVDQFDRYLAYGLPVDQPTDAATLVDRIYTPITGEVTA
jgi:NitT/TauT family transport system substrate-binding protein